MAQTDSFMEQIWKILSGKQKPTKKLCLFLLWPTVKETYSLHNKDTPSIWENKSSKPLKSTQTSTNNTIFQIPKSRKNQQKHHLLNFFQKKSRNICTVQNLAVHLQRFSKKARVLSSAGSEHLPYKQRVGGSNPSAPTQQLGRRKSPFFCILIPHFFS